MPLEFGAEQEGGDGVAVTVHFDLGFHGQVIEQGQAPRIEHRDLGAAVEGVDQLARQFGLHGGLVAQPGAHVAHGVVLGGGFPRRQQLLEVGVGLAGLVRMHLAVVGDARRAGVQDQQEVGQLRAQDVVHVAAGGQLDLGGLVGLEQLAGPPGGLHAMFCLPSSCSVVPDRSYCIGAQTETKHKFFGN